MALAGPQAGSLLSTSSSKVQVVKRARSESVSKLPVCGNLNGTGVGEATSWPQWAFAAAGESPDPGSPGQTPPPPPTLSSRVRRSPPPQDAAARALAYGRKLERAAVRLGATATV